MEIFENIEGGLGGLPCNGLGRNSFYFGYLLYDIGYVGTLVTATSVWYGCKIWRICFDDDALKRHGRHYLLEKGVFVGDHAADAYAETALYSPQGL